MYLLRDSFGKGDYNMKWNRTDPNWTPDLIKQIPLGIAALD